MRLEEKDPFFFFHLCHTLALSTLPLSRPSSEIKSSLCEDVSQSMEKTRNTAARAANTAPESADVSDFKINFKYKMLKWRDEQTAKSLLTQILRYIVIKNEKNMMHILKIKGI